MSDAAKLLPPNSTDLESAIAKVAGFDVRPEVIATLWDADACPAPLLPWLAWALSVDEWDDAWTEDQQRATIKGSIALHRKKGTPWAVRQALARIGLTRTALVERPDGAHWAEFDLDITVEDRPITEALHAQLLRILAAYKPARSHLRYLAVALGTTAMVHAGCVVLSGETTTIYPGP